MMAWTDRELHEASLVLGPTQDMSDTYRLHVPGVGGKPGKMLDVPGWMVGDPKGAALRVRAASIIRDRLFSAQADQGDEP